MDKLLGYKIRKMRELRGYKQEHMAKGLGIDKTSYGDIESGQTKMTVERLKKIAELLDTTPQAIESFDDRIVFNIHDNQHGVGSYITINNSSLEELAKVLAEPYKQQLASKDEEIQFLRDLVKKAD